MVVLQKPFEDIEILLSRRSLCSGSKIWAAELNSTFDVAFFHSLHLSFSNYIHYLVPSQRSMAGVWKGGDLRSPPTRFIICTRGTADVGDENIQKIGNPPPYSGFCALHLIEFIAYYRSKRGW